jgi:CRISPR/Cas system-associated exonuclease Cas4 (RecB family)
MIHAMGVTGTADAAGVPPTTRVLWLCQVTGEKVPLAVCLECARQRSRRDCQFDEAILRALANSLAADEALAELNSLAESAGATVLRVTSLLGCARQTWYGLQGGRPLEKPANHWARLRGVIIHAALENLARGEGVVTEIRLHASLERLGIKAWVSGRVDHYDAQLRRIVDYKTINTNGKKLAKLDLPKRQHVGQLWIYSWLLAQNGYPAPIEGRVIYIDMATVHATDVIMPEDHAETEAYVVAKARAIVTAGPEGPAGDAKAAWECRYCAFAGRCSYRISGKAGAGENGADQALAIKAAA